MPNINADALNNPGINFENRSTDHAAPGSGRAMLYVKNGGVYVRLDTGDPAPVGGDVALAEGRLAVGDAQGILSALSLGTEGYVVTADASGHATWASPGESGTGDVVKLATVTVSDAGGAASIAFTNISGSYSHLKLWLMARHENTGNIRTVRMTVNSQGGTYYNTQSVGANGSTVQYATVNAGAAYWVVGHAFQSDFTAGRFATVEIDLPWYAVDGIYRVMRSRSEAMVGTNGNYSQQILYHGECSYTSPVTSITLVNEEGDDFAQYSRAILYGIA